MKIAIVGLGLIGGSLAKTIKKRTAHLCYGLDHDASTLEKAQKVGAITQVVGPEALGEMDFTIIALHPRQTINFLLENVGAFRPGSVVMDVCGVKKAVVDAVTAPLAERGVYFVGAHPMAGREFSGFDYAQDDLFQRASFIITPVAETSPAAVETVKELAAELGFPKVVISTPEVHDTTIAFTSQLAHVVSNAYIKSPSLQNQSGFSAGSFLDLTRVAKLNEDMWTDLFLMNREPLLYEVETIIGHLCQYRDALQADDPVALKQLLRDGRILKEQSLKQK